MSRIFAFIARKFVDAGALKGAAVCPCVYLDVVGGKASCVCLFKCVCVCVCETLWVRMLHHPGFHTLRSDTEIPHKL